MHHVSSRWQLGLSLALITTLFWGALPIALKIVLSELDPYTLTWYRFLTAALVMTIYLALTKRFHIFVKLKQPVLLILALLAIISLTSNYLLFIIGLDYLDPSSAQIVIQLAPVFLLLGGLLIFKEPFNRLQWCGFALLLLGLLVFFNERLIDLVTALNHYTIGVLFIFAAAITWAAYALAQKELLSEFKANDIMWLIYISGTVFYIPLSHPQALFTLSDTAFYVLLFCALNTLVAYGCFAEALNHWPASKVSAVLSITPILTVFMMLLTQWMYPQFDFMPDLNILNYVGAALVVGGSVFCALGKHS